MSFALTWDDAFFDTDVTFRPPDRSTSVSCRAYLQPPVTNNPATSEQRLQPDASQSWLVVTNTDPGASHHWWAEWGGVARRVLRRHQPHPSGVGARPVRGAGFGGGGVGRGRRQQGGQGQQLLQHDRVLI